MKQNKETLKKFFETGDKPTQQQYADLIDSYIDTKQPIGEANRRFVIDELGDVSVASEQKAPEYTLSDIVSNKLSLLKDGVVVKELDLSTYLDDTNLARLVSGTVDANGMATFTRDDNSTFTVNLSNLKGNLTLDEVLSNGNISDKAIQLIGGSKGFEISIAETTGAKSTLLAGNLNILDNLGSVNLNHSSLGFNDKSTGFNFALNKPNILSDNRVVSFQDKSGTIATIEDIPQIQAGTNITIDNSNPLQPIINATAGSGATTDLSYNAATRTLVSSTGTDAVLPLADATNAGLMKANFYEEGFFTPSVLGGAYTTGSSAGTSYVREGNIVKVSIKIESVNGTGSSQLAIGNLPFPVSTSGYNHGIVGRFIGSTYATPYDLVANLNAGSNTIRFIPISSTSFISNINFTNGEIRVDMVYRTNVYTS